MKFLIAFGKRPQPGFLDTLVQLARNDGVRITGAYLCPGPGCWNLAISLDHSDAENFVRQLTMILMPAKYEPTDDPLLVEGQFTMVTE